CSHDDHLLWTTPTTPPPAAAAQDEPHGEGEERGPRERRVARAAPCADGGAAAAGRVARSDRRIAVDRGVEDARVVVVTPGAAVGDRRAHRVLGRGAGRDLDGGALLADGAGRALAIGGGGRRGGLVLAL